MLHTIKRGSPELKIKAVMALMGKALATSVRQTPEEVKMAREALLSVMGKEKIMDLEGEEIVAGSTFVAVDDGTDD